MKRPYIIVCIVFIIMLAAAITLNEKNINNEELPVPPITTEEPEEKPLIAEKVITDFSKVLFIGDSRTQGLMLFSGVPEATFYAETGLTVRDVVEKPIIDKDTTIIDALKENTFESIYIMLGINELGWAYEDSFEEAYEKMITEIKVASPESEIAVQTIMPVNPEQIENPKEYVNNDRIREYNDIIKNVSKKQGVYLIDTYSIMCDENGNLYEQASPDGIHLNREFCQRWLNYLKGEPTYEI